MRGQSSLLQTSVKLGSWYADWSPLKGSEIKLRNSVRYCHREELEERRGDLDLKTPMRAAREIASHSLAMTSMEVTDEYAALHGD